MAVGSTTLDQNITTWSCSNEMKTSRKWRVNLVEGVVDEEEERSVKREGRHGSHSEYKGGRGGRRLCSLLCDLEMKNCFWSDLPTEEVYSQDSFVLDRVQLELGPWVGDGGKISRRISGK